MKSKSLANFSTFRNSGIRELVLVMVILALVSCNTPASITPTATPSQTMRASSTPLIPTMTPTNQPTPTEAMAPMSEFMKGFGYASGWEGDYSSASSDWILTSVVKPLGVTWIKIQISCDQDTDRSTTINCFHQRVPTADDLSHVIKEAHRIGLRVMLEPSINVIDGSNGAWAGTIGMSFSEKQWQDWFASYDQMILDLAGLAEKDNVDYLEVGSELEFASTRETEWRNLVAKVRKVYHGPVTYSSDQEFEWDRIKWWDALDAIGIHPYNFQLSTADQPTVENVVAAWKPIVDRIAALSKKWDRPIIITEIGYQSQHGISHGYMYGPNDSWKLDTRESAILYQALINAFQGKPWFRGLFWWVINSWTNYSEPTTFIFNPNKPEVDIVRSFYGAPPAPTVTPSAPLPSDFRYALSIYDDELNPSWENYPPNGDPANIDFFQSKIAVSGNAIRVNLVGELIFSQEPSIDLSHYQWLEFYVFIPPNTPNPPMLSVSLRDAGFHPMPYTVDLTNSQYIQDGHLEKGKWQRVDIPLDAMGPLLEPITSITIVNGPQPPMVIYVDNVRLLGN